MKGWTMVQLTDLHLRKLTSLHTTIARRVDAIMPQLVVLTGDAVDDPANESLLDEFLGMITKPGRRILATWGNHEHWAMDLESVTRLYAKRGVQVLANDAVVVDDVWIAGADDGYTEHTDFARTFRDAPDAHGPSTRILLTHAPGVLDAPPKDSPRFDLSLSGHTHGGQVRLGTRALVTPPGSGRFVHGFYDAPMGRVYVSKGLGMVGPQARFCCRP
ncbi:MAG: metallophosphoesterase, partial [Myxococcota bacterium]